MGNFGSEIANFEVVVLTCVRLKKVLESILLISYFWIPLTPNDNPSLLKSHKLCDYVAQRVTLKMKASVHALKRMKCDISLDGIKFKLNTDVMQMHHHKYDCFRTYTRVFY